MVGGPTAPGYEYRYGDERNDWVGGPSDYYSHAVKLLPLTVSAPALTFKHYQYDQSYEHPGPFLEDPGSSNASTTVLPANISDKSRGRKRTRVQVHNDVRIDFP